jgi:hypothetical protein
MLPNFDVARKPPGTSGSQLDNKPAKISKNPLTLLA